MPDPYRRGTQGRLLEPVRVSTGCVRVPNNGFKNFHTTRTLRPDAHWHPEARLTWAILVRPSHGSFHDCPQIQSV
eukprot:1440251-Rhodomonas_salina.1